MIHDRALHLALLLGLPALAAPAGAQQPPASATAAWAPSAGWAARVVAAVRPHIRMAEELAGNPTAEVQVRLSPDGTISEARLVRSSGVPSWDAAVMRAVEMTGRFPADVDGRVPPVLVIAFRPKS